MLGTHKLENQENRTGGGANGFRLPPVTLNPQILRVIKHMTLRVAVSRHALHTAETPCLQFLCYRLHQNFALINPVRNQLRGALEALLAHTRESHDKQKSREDANSWPSHLLGTPVAM